VGHVFLSHSTDDDAIARALQRALGDHGLNVWIDSREMRGGDLLSPEIRGAIENANACLVLVSPSGLQSSWVGRELSAGAEALCKATAAKSRAGNCTST
jgi:hypothetical protein